MRIKNISNGPRGVNTVDAQVLVEAGEAIDAKLSKAELKVAKATGWFEFDGDADESDDEKVIDFDAMSDDELRAHIEKRDNKAPHPSAKRETLLARARGEEEKA